MPLRKCIECRRVYVCDGADAWRQATCLHCEADLRVTSVTEVFDDMRELVGLPRDHDESDDDRPALPPRRHLMAA